MKLPLFAATLLLAGCQGPARDADGLPPATQTGANTGGFLLDGKPYVDAAGSQDERMDVTAERIAGVRRLYVELRWNTPHNDTLAPRRLQVLLDTVTGPGLYRATAYVDPAEGRLCGSRLATYRVPPNGNPSRYLSGPQAPGRIRLTRLDTVAHVASGTFEGELHEEYGPGVFRVTKGRFDCVYMENHSLGTNTKHGR